ncbi:hypothetical protein Bhyg_00556, partial [Pseudolycoriella hygida]
ECDEHLKPFYIIEKLRWSHCCEFVNNLLAFVFLENCRTMARQMEPTTSNYANNKSIIDEDIVNEGCADSGYASHSSLSHATSINASALRSSHYLQPIYENVPVSSFASAAELTPTSQSIKKISAFHITTPDASLKRTASLPCTPVKIGTPKKRRLDPKSLSKTYRNLIDDIDVDENSENRNIADFQISPIKSVNVLQERNGKFERKGSFSSTPICEGPYQKSMSSTKTDFFSSKNLSEKNGLLLRKTKSFSPSKKRWLAARGGGINLETVSIPENAALSNSARKSIKRLLCSQDDISPFERPTTPQAFDVTPTAFINSDIKSPINYRSTSNETPVKKIRRNLSFNLSRESPKKKIAIPKTPCSPLKQRPPAIKRPATVKEPVAAKRPLFDISPLLPKRKYFTHLKHLDILSHLSETTTAIEKILNHLDPKDIYSMYNVCGSWRAIIKNNSSAYSKRNKYYSTLMKNKENLQRKPILRQRSLSTTGKTPLRSSNLNVIKTPLRRASTQSTINDPFLLINENQRFTKCSSCGRPSIIHENNNDDKVHEL